MCLCGLLENPFRRRLVKTSEDQQASDKIPRPEDLPRLSHKVEEELPYIEQIFGITDRYGPIFNGTKEHLIPVPQELEDELKKADTRRGRLDILVKYCFQRERDFLRRALISTDVPIRHLSFTRGSHLELVVKDESGTISGTTLITSYVDYSIWCGDESAGSGVVIAGVEDYKEFGMAEFQCLTYMATALKIRKSSSSKDAVMHGIVSDGESFNFLSLDGDGKLNQWRPPQPWNKATRHSIYGLTRLAIRNCALSPHVPLPKGENMGSDDWMANIPVNWERHSPF